MRKLYTLIFSMLCFYRGAYASPNLGITQDSFIEQFKKTYTENLSTSQIPLVDFGISENSHDERYAVVEEGVVFSFSDRNKDGILDHFSIFYRTDGQNVPERIRLIRDAAVQSVVGKSTFNVLGNNDFLNLNRLMGKENSFTNVGGFFISHFYAAEDPELQTIMISRQSTKI